MKAKEKMLGILLAGMALAAQAGEPLCVRGVYPSLAYYNDEGECGTGAVVPWAGSLWVITYGPHCPVGGSDKLYQVSPDKRLVVRPESVGGTHANRMIHRESGQLLIGTYLIGSDGNVRTIPIHTMPGRLTGVARHLSDPAGKVYVTDMEEALYELDVNTLATRVLIRDGHNDGAFRKLFADIGVEPPCGWKDAEPSTLFGYHGKGTCSGFGRVFYANNGWYNKIAMRDPTVPAGALAEYHPGDKQWRLLRPNQFTEITTRDGIYGNEHPDSNPVWALGWDAKSVIVSVTTNGREWVDYRLPKGSHSYDGAHGWNTEWPRIREIGDPGGMLATMHGTFWRFPSGFRPGAVMGIRPRSNYLKVVGDFCEWNGKVVLGCDDSAMNEFMNKRRAKGALKGPAKSHSNLRFVDPGALDRLGPAIGNAIVWNREDVRNGEVSDPYLVAGYDFRWVWVSDGEYAVEVDADGTGAWRRVGGVRRGGNDLSGVAGEWVRFVAKSAQRNATVALCMRAKDERPVRGRAFTDAAGVALGGGERALLHVNAIDPRSLSLSVGGVKGYSIDADLSLSECPAAASAVARDVPLAAGAVRREGSSMLYVDDSGHRWRLPVARGAAGRDAAPCRVCREVCTERDLFNAGGIFYELPAENAHGFAGVRPVAAHGRDVFDYCSWRGLFAVSLPGEVRFMDVDDAWNMGKAAGYGGPWDGTPVRAGEASDAYLLNGFDRKTLELLADGRTTVAMEVDATGWGVWVKYADYDLAPGVRRVEKLPRALSGYWVRFVSSSACVATAALAYE